MTEAPKIIGMNGLERQEGRSSSVVEDDASMWSECGAQQPLSSGGTGRLRCCGSASRNAAAHFLIRHLLVGLTSGWPVDALSFNRAGQANIQQYPRPLSSLRGPMAGGGGGRADDRSA